MSNAIIQYRKGDIDADGFKDLITYNSIDAAGAAIDSSIGQAIIPIPFAGTLIGSIIIKTTLSLGKNILNKHVFLDEEHKKFNTQLVKVHSYFFSLMISFSSFFISVMY